METVLITGGTGFVGQALTHLLTEHGYHVIVLSRQPHTHTNSGNSLLTYARWDLRQQTIDIAAVQAADFIVHLAGANVGAHRWTAAYKKEILESRTQSSQLLFNTLQQHPNKVRKFISASGTGYYGENPGAATPFTETDPPADDFLGSTCQAWEAGALQMQQLNKDVVIFRTGIALNRNGGAMKEFYKPLRFGFATILGSGEQWVSWIHLHDLVRLYFNAIVNPQLTGIFNAVAPQPVRHKELIMTMAKAAKGNSFIPVHIPAFALKLAVGEMSTEVLKSTLVSSRKIQELEFQFSYPDIQQAMEQLVQ
ncbi:MAG TPA: TIGR01777 family oxidoreductase [Chitinophaga sp.]|uniref:TIGR01777 family oxidoreductase n=1 Tax=Chitinophaga sp. TaxID=1869181 RepID=UPI002DBB357E|nr:TIGR01777 family oxidoreductase [Chitinophaga sp.]HEU4553217.1 TIGR01777 family oxidoreductase [Chitinophaga sp.]